MTAQKYTAKSGRTLLRPNLSEREARHLMLGDEMLGWCLACGSEQDGVEPDARKYTCESCGEPMVYGIEELLLRGIARIEGEVMA